MRKSIREKLTSMMVRVFVDDITVTPLDGEHRYSTTARKIVWYKGEQVILYMVNAAFCSRCYSLGVYISKDNTLALCPTCEHVLEADR